MICPLCLRSGFTLAIVALALSPAAAQTCAGTLQLEFYDVASETRPAGRYVIPTGSLDVTAQFFHGRVSGLPTVVEARLDPALRLEGKESLSADARLYTPGTVFSIAPRCGLGLLHLEIEYWHETMTLDIYRVPSHIPLRLDEAIPFHPGRFVLDFRTADEVGSADQGTVYSVAAVRPADG